MATHTRPEARESSGSTRSQNEDERLEAEREPTPCTVVFRKERKTQPFSLGVPLGWPQRSGGQAPEADALSSELQARRRRNRSACSGFRSVRLSTDARTSHRAPCTQSMLGASITHHDEDQTDDGQRITRCARDARGRGRAAWCAGFGSASGGGRGKGASATREPAATCRRRALDRRSQRGRPHG